MSCCFLDQVQRVAMRGLRQSDGAGEAAIADRPGRVAAGHQPGEIHAGLPGDFAGEERGDDEAKAPVQPCRHRDDGKQQQHRMRRRAHIRGQGPQAAAHDRGIRDGKAGRQDQDHLQREGQDLERAVIPGIQDHRHRAAGCEDRREDRDEDGQADR